MYSVIIFLSQLTLLRWLIFLTWNPECDSYLPALLDLFISSGTSICSTMAFPPLENFILTTGYPVSLQAYDTIIVLIGMVFVII